MALAFARHLKVEQLGAQLPAVTPFTLTDPRQLAQQVEQAREQGWAAAIEEETQGISAIAAPILGINGELIGTLALVATVQAIHRQTDPEQVRALKKAALRTSWNMGFKGEF